MSYLLSFALILGAYLLGSLSFAVIVSQLMGLDDPRKYGSGNPGATNVLRAGNKLAALLTLLLDALKGFIPVFVVLHFTPHLALYEGLAACIGLAAFMGHLWPVFFSFKGGKGVATAAGILLAFHWGLGLAAIATWLLVVVISRYSSLGALITALLIPIYQLLGWRWDWPVGSFLVVSILMSLLLIWRHSKNIENLLKGCEGKLGQKDPSPLNVSAAQANKFSPDPSLRRTSRGGRSRHRGKHHVN
jgi:acyl phosphate:glycerol-3-phosphate acyltransferase